MENEKGQCEQLAVRTVSTETQLFLVKGMSRPNLSLFVCLFASKALNCKPLNLYKVEKENISFNLKGVFDLEGQPVLVCSLIALTFYI